MFEEEVLKLRAQVSANTILIGLLFRALRDHRIADPNRVLEKLDEMLVGAASEIPMTGRDAEIANLTIDLARSVLKPLT